MVELFGTPQPRFSAAYPWHQLDSDTIGLAVDTVTRPRNLSEYSLQLIGHLTQVVNSGKKRDFVKSVQSAH